MSSTEYDESQGCLASRDREQSGAGKIGITPFGVFDSASRVEIRVDAKYGFLRFRMKGGVNFTCV